MISIRTSRIFSGLLAVMPILPSGCAMVTSTPISRNEVATPGTISYALPKTLVAVEFSDGLVPKDRGQHSVLDATQPNVRLEVLIVRDDRQTYTATYDPSWLSDDTLTIETNADGDKLKSVNGVAVDRTGDILAEIAKDTGRFAKGLGPNLAGEAPVEHWVTVRVIDPEDSNELSRTNAWLKALGANVRISCQSCGDSTKEPVASADGYDGIVTRATRPIFIELCDVVSTANSCSEDDQRTMVTRVDSYNSSPLVVVPIARSIGIRRSTVLTFNDQGILTKVEETKPSEMYAVVQWPGQMVGSFYQGIVASQTDKKSVIDAQKNLIDSQTNLVNAQAKLIQAQTDLEKAKKGANAPPPAGGGNAPPPPGPQAPPPNQN